MAVTLRLLGGSSYLDADNIFHVKPNHTYAVMHYVLENWICNDEVIAIDVMSYLKDVEEMKKMRYNLVIKQTTSLLML